MTRILVVVVLLGVFHGATAQITVKKHFTKDNKPTNAENSYYYEVGKKVLMQRGEKSLKWLDTVYIDTVKTFYTSTNSIRSRCFYSQGDREGSYSVYHLNGRLKEKGFYHKSKKTSYVIYWTDDGSVKQVLQYFYSEKFAANDSFKIVGYWKNGHEVVKAGFGYYDDDLFDAGLMEKGKVVDGFRDSLWQVNMGDSVVSQELYERGKFVRGESFYKGKTFKYEEIKTIAEFAGGVEAMYRFLVKNQRYPSGARSTGIQDRVFVKFCVDAEGNISEIKILKGQYQILNDEAVRLIKISPKWVPGKIRGIPFKSDFVLPVYFKLEP